MLWGDLWLFDSTRGILHLAEVNSLGHERLQKSGHLSWVSLTALLTALAPLCPIVYV